MGERQGVPVRPVVHGKDPAAAAGLDRMQGIAGHGLEGLRQKGLAIAHDQLPQAGAGITHLVQALEGSPRGGAPHLHDIAPERLPGDQGTEQAHDPLAPEHRDLVGGAILHHVDERDDRLMREVDVANHVTGLVQHLTTGQADDLEVGLKPRKSSGSREARSRLVRG